MSRIVDRCPFFDAETFVETSSGPVYVRAHQIVLWVSLRVRGAISPRFPTVLDTGHSHNFSIREEDLRAWTGIAPETLRLVGSIRMNNRLVMLRDAELVLYRNAPGKRDDVQGEPHLLEMSQGIVIHRVADPFAPRLPVLGVRALVRNRLTLVIEGAAKVVSIDAEAGR
jgi:hypothetical protein